MRFSDKQIRQSQHVCFLFRIPPGLCSLITGATRVLHPSSERSRGAAYCRQMVATRGKGNRWFLPLYSSNLSLNVCGVCSSHRTILVEFQCLILMDQEFIILCLFLRLQWPQRLQATFGIKTALPLFFFWVEEAAKCDVGTGLKFPRGWPSFHWKVVKESHNCKECHSWCWDAF